MIAKRLVQFLFALMIGIALWYTFDASLKAWRYVKLSNEATPTNLAWNVHELTEESFAIEAHYAFVFRDHLYQNSTLFDRPTPFWNAWAAEQEIQNWAKKTWTVWFCSWDPEYSSLQKKFPIKECLSALTLWGIIGFLWIRLSSATKQHQGRP